MQIKYGQTVTYAGRTHVGKIRDQNEDCFHINADMGLYVVADGMGGHDSGEVASRIAVDTIVQKVAQGVDLAAAIELAHQAIIDGVETGAGKHGMGTTVVAVQLLAGKYTLAWVGDSRAYLWDEGIVQISKDHSMVQMLIDSGQISEAQARIHPRKNIIYQNLGAENIENFQVSVKKGDLYKHQKIILCSDGLSDEVEDEEINNIVRRMIAQAESSGEAADENAVNEALADKLVEAALDNGGRDNISVIVISASSMAPDKSEVNSMPSEIGKDTLIPENQGYDK